MPPTQPTLIDPAEPVPPIEDRIAALELRHNAFVGLYGSGPGVRPRGGAP